MEIRAGVWDDVERPFIVIQPQNRAPTNSAQDYDRDELDALVQFVVDNYPVDPRRLYILGNSQGGRATYQYLALYARRMAAGTAGPGGVISEADFGCRLEDTPLWAFHGENDEDTNVAAGAFDPCFVARNVSRANQPELYDDVYPTCAQRLERPFPQSRMTMWQNTAHNAWTPAFEDVTQGFGTPAWTADEMWGFETNWVQSDPMEYPDGVYTWLLEHDRPGVNAGGALTVPGDVDTFTIAPEVVDDDAWTATWEQLSGPAVTMTPGMDGMDGSVEITEFQYGTSYSFRVFVVDADNQWAEDTLEVTIEAEVIEGGETSSGSGTSDGDSSGSPGSSGSSGSPGSTSSTGGDSTGSTSGASGSTGGEASGTTGGGSTSGSASCSGSGDDGVSASGSASGSGTGEADTDSDSDSAGQGSS